MRLFAADRISSVMQRMGYHEGEPLTHPLMTRVVEKAQKRVEERNFMMRKNLLEYDEVLNRQREIIYKYREQIIHGMDMHRDVVTFIGDTVANVVELYLEDDKVHDTGQIAKMLEWFQRKLFMKDLIDPDDIVLESLSDIQGKLQQAVLQRYDDSLEHTPAEDVRIREREALLQVIDEEWRYHLRELDGLKGGIGLRGYGQKDPLVEYKNESFGLFEELMVRIAERVTVRVFRANSGIQLLQKARVEEVKTRHDEVNTYQTVSSGEGAAQPQTDSRSSAKPEGPVVEQRTAVDLPGRNDPCICGSGKKFKKCCWKKYH